MFLYCILVYTIYGLDVGMAYYSDLNLFYMFVLGVLLQIQLRMLSQETHANDFSVGSALGFAMVPSPSAGHVARLSRWKSG